MDEGTAGEESASSEEPEERIAVLLQAAADLNRLLTEPESLYGSLLDRLYRLVPFHSGSIQVMEGDALRIVALRGELDPGIVLGLRFPMDPLFPNLTVIRERRPVSVQDVRKDFPHFLTREKEFGSGSVRSWLGVPMACGDEVVGMIALDRHAVDPFPLGQVHIVKSFADMAAVAIQNARTYRRLLEALEARDRLMKELNHRVKNNLQLVLSLLAIQARRIEDTGTREALSVLEGRIESISNAHELLFRQEEPGTAIDLGEYLESIAQDFRGAFLGPERSIALSTDFHRIEGNVAMAVPLGLILNELLTNAAKYAFPGDAAGTVSARLRSENDRGTLTVEDSGWGMPSGSSGFGTQLVRSLAEQIRGRADVRSGAGGTAWTVEFPLG